MPSRSLSLRRFCSHLIAPALLLSLACDSESNSDEIQGNQQEAPRAPQPEVKKNEVLHIPVGELQAGSQPGDPGRDPGLEPLPHRLKLGPYRIDSHLYRRDGKLLLGQSVEEAARLCAQQESGGSPGRLCTEAEWERACRGEAQSLYPGGEEACSDNCISEFGSFEMTSRPEWTSSTFSKGSEVQGSAVLRGAAQASARAEARCARRQKDAPRSETGFRCCYGAKNAATLAESDLGTPYELTDLSLEELSKLLKADAHTASLAQDLSFFGERAVETVFSRGPGDSMGFSLTEKPVLWQPARGLRLLVVAARSGKKRSFVVAYYLGGEKKRLAGSFIMENEKGPIVLAFANSIRPRMHFSGCWGCAGETGKLLFREPEEIVLLQP